MARLADEGRAERIPEMDAIRQRVTMRFGEGMGFQMGEMKCGPACLEALNQGKSGLPFPSRG